VITKLLVGYDGSEPAKLAFDFALDLAGRYDAEIHVLAVARPPDFGAEVETEAVIEQSRRHYERVLQRLKMRMAEAAPQRPDTRAQFHVVVGHPAEQLVRYAEGHGIDHIVVGHRGHTLFERWLIGSVARQVIAYAHCAVTVVRK
jgi:nucleotide-binding universal stress UspA family protein